MAYIYPNNIGANAMWVKSYMKIVNEYIKKIDDKVDIVAIRLGLQSVLDGIEDGNNATVKRQSNICNPACETPENTKRLTYTTTGLADISEKAPIDGTEVADFFIALREFIATIKIDCDVLLSMVKKLQKDEGSSDGLLRK